MSINDCDEEKIINAIQSSLQANEFQHLELDSRSVLSLANLTLYPVDCKIEWNGQSMVLGRRPFELLHLLAQNAGRTLTKEQLYCRVWNDAVDINVDETIRYHISEIRKKLIELTDVCCIETVWGIGYRFKENTSERKDSPL